MTFEMFILFSRAETNTWIHSDICSVIYVFEYKESTVEPVYYGHLGTNQRCPDYQGVLIFQVSLYDKAPFGTIARCPGYAGIHIFKCPD